MTIYSNSNSEKEYESGCNSDSESSDYANEDLGNDFK